jgi:mono/diheme cytochrome c family protein
MKRSFLGSLFFCATLAALLPGQAGAADDASFQKTVQPFLAKNCIGCHNEKLKSANLSLEGASAAGQPEVWGKVLEKLSAGKMPPPGLPAPPKADIAAVTSWIEGLLKQPASNRESDPGRVTARRLNRVEYNNTIRDLLDVAVRPADEFPVDDSGYGFDNIGDVLSISPMLMEKYMAAANRVSRVAVYGETLPPKPTVLARLLNRRSPDANDVLSTGAYLPYSMRGAMYGSWVFPVDGEYEFRLRIANFRGDTEAAGLSPEERAKAAEERRQRFLALKKGGGRGGPRPEVTPEQLKAREEAARKAAPPRKLILALDGAPIITTVVEGVSAFDYDRGEYTVRVPVKAGERSIRASFPELADLADPRQNINPDMRRGLFVDYLEIVGPREGTTQARMRAADYRESGPPRLPPSGDAARSGRQAAPRHAGATIGRHARRRRPAGARSDPGLSPFSVSHRARSPHAVQRRRPAPGQRA